MKKSNYQTRIETKLASLSIAINPITLVKLNLAKRHGQTFDKTITGGQEWKVIHLKRGHKCCDLCGHNPIKNIFVIENESNGKKLEIGSKCATNYLDADLVAGLCKMWNMEYKKIVNPIKFENELELLEWACSEDGGRKFTSFYSVRRKMWGLVNSGNAHNLIYKINQGKTIGKREKEVLEFWAYVKANQDSLASVEAEYQAERKATLAKREEERLAYHKARIERMNAERKASAYKRATAVLADFFSNIESYVPLKVQYELAASVIALEGASSFQIDVAKNVQSWLEKGYKVTDNQLSVLNGAFEPQPEPSIELEELFSTLRAASLDAWSTKFVKSVNAFYRKRGMVSDKQLACLNKIRNKFV